MGVMDTKDYSTGINLDDFFLKGFVLLHEDNLEKNENIIEYLAKKYIEKIFPVWKLIEFSVSEKVLPEDRITFWHNDSRFVGCNLTFLYYMDDMSPEIGGSISIRNGIYEEKIYPKNGTLIMLSQQPNVEHKAEFCKTRRKMYNIDYLVKGLTDQF
jgi:hypothetical protein